jgi:hypothetical protein
MIAERPEGSKLARAESVAPMFEAGRVLFPEQATPWRDTLIEELASFPTGRHDDQVDALAYALRRLRDTGHGGGVRVVHHGRHGQVLEQPRPDDLEADGRTLTYHAAKRREAGRGHAYYDPRFE